MECEKIISIVTPSFNHAEFIEESLISVITQEGDFYIDYQVIDGGSSDHTVNILKKFEEIITKDTEFTELNGLKFYKSNRAQNPIKCKGLSFRWISEKDKGQSDAINKGLRIAVGYVMAFLNSDDTYYPGTLKKVMLYRWGSADFVYGEGMWTSKDGKELIPYPTFPPNKYNFVYQCTLCQPAVFFRKSTFEKLGEFSTEFHVIFDFEYWMRAVFYGMKFRRINSMLATSRFYAENKTMADKNIQVDEISVLKKKYYTKPFKTIGRWKVKMARKSVHKPTVERVTRLHELINSDIRYGIK